MKPFIDKLMAKMTLEEKIGQTVLYTSDMTVTGPTVKDDYKEDVMKGRVGALFNLHGAKYTREMQKMVMENSRLKIPLLFGYDVIHGYQTVFPIPLGESSTWDLPRMELSARIAAREAASAGLHWTYAPMVDISRDPRWGRISEGAGEDPWLGSKVAAARVKGFQGPNLGSTDSVMACVKHFAAYGAPEGGRDYNIVNLSERSLFETYLPPYEAAVKAGVASVMTSFNEINGVPASSNKWLLTDLLRKQWGFKGFVVTDYTSINELIPHGVAANGTEAAALAFKAGVDMDMQGGLFSAALPKLIKDKKIDRAALDRSVRRILEAKYRMGLFQDPYRFSDEKRAEKELMSKENLEAARDIARRSIVLLKNDKASKDDKEAVLPLKRSGTIALIGPFANNQRDMIGNWSGAGEWSKAVSLVQGFQDMVNAGGGEDKKIELKVVYALGANVLDDPKKIEFLNKNGGDIKVDERSSEDLIKEAVRVAKKSDVVVMALGETQGMSGEAASRAYIRVPENQQALLKAVKATGKPLVLVLFNGRPLALPLETSLADSILETWFLGTEAGHAITDVLFGDYNPSGKLTVSFPYNEGQIPIYYSVKNTGRPMDPNIKYTSKYLDTPNRALYPFGWGLSYTTFEYSDLKLSARQMKPGQTLNVSVKVTNTGTRDGEETVQLYLRDMVASVTRPLKELRGFKKVFLKAGESQTVTLPLTVEDLKFYDQRMKWIAEPGEFTVMVGGNSLNLKDTKFTLTGKPAWYSR
jgi:beta-glucosidase